MDKDAAARDPESDTARSGFDARAQSAADRRQDEQDRDEDGGVSPAGH